MSEQVAAVLDVLAERFGTTAEHLWGVLVYQQYIGASAQIVWTLILSVAAFFLFREGISIYRSIDARDRPLYGRPFDSTDRLIGSTVLVCTGCLAVMLLVACLHAAVSGFLNPEYGAIQTVLDAIK